jgi:hypothetical protein
MTYYSEQMQKAEIHYEIHDKEILPAVPAFNELKRHLGCAALPICVSTGHKNHEYFTTMKIFN